LAEQVVEIEPGEVEAAGLSVRPLPDVYSQLFQVSFEVGKRFEVTFGSVQRFELAG
jgi:hypothetical protein